MANDQKEIFLSYSWKQKDVADQIDNAFQGLGIRFTRDTRDIPYQSSIRKYMGGIRQADYVIMLISDEFLKSKNCMYEVLEILKERNHKSRMLFITLDSAKVYVPDYRVQIMKYWKIKKARFEKGLKGVSLEDLGNEGYTLKEYKEIQLGIGDFMALASDTFSIKFEDLKVQAYKPILDIIGYEKTGLFHKCLEISQIVDKDNRAIEIDTLVYENPKYAMAHFLKGYYVGTTKRSISHFNRAISLDPDLVVAYYNRGIARKRNGDLDGAIEDYNRTIELDPNFAKVYYNRGHARFLKVDHDGSIEDFNRAIELNHDDNEIALYKSNLALAHHARGFARKYDGNLKGAIADLTLAIEFGNKPSNITLEDLYREHGRPLYDN